MEMNKLEEWEKDVMLRLLKYHIDNTVMTVQESNKFGGLAVKIQNSMQWVQPNP